MNESHSETRYIFGPVYSRRLGRSLGIDVTPLKTCTFDCIYCQLGPTKKQVIRRSELVPLEPVYQQLSHALSQTPAPDYITFSGSGEPTLHSKIGECISHIKEISDIPVAVITNSSLLWDREVQTALGQADLVIPSLDAPDEAGFSYINHPHSGLRFNDVVTGLAEFSSQFRGKLWLEIFFLGGVNTTTDQVKKLITHVSRIAPDKCQLNTVARPPAYSFAFPASRDKLEEIATRFPVPTEIIAQTPQSDSPAATSGDVSSVRELILRRPCTIEDIAAGLGIHRNEAIKHVTRLMQHDEITTKQHENKTYFYPQS